MGFVKEFKSFAMRGNVMDMAVGIVIGVAFGKIVTSLVNDVIMPPIGLLMGGVDFSHLAVTLKATAGTEPAVTLKYGMLINTIIDFLIVVFAIFLVVKMMNALKRKKEDVPAPPTPTVEERLLRDIRDILRSKGDKIL
jgi:large conductance mechanosensitive channel